MPFHATDILKTLKKTTAPIFIARNHAPIICLPRKNLRMKKSKYHGKKLTSTMIVKVKKPRLAAVFLQVAQLWFRYFLKSAFKNCLPKLRQNIYKPCCPAIKLILLALLKPMAEARKCPAGRLNPNAVIDSCFALVSQLLSG
jgi:hypothetical protein